MKDSENKKLWNLTFSILNLDATAKLMSNSNKGMKIFCCTMNEIVMSFDDPVFMKMINDADMLTLDGMPLVWAMRLRGFNAERVYGPELMKKFVVLNTDNKISQIFIGDKKNKDYFEKYGSYLVLPFKDEFNEKDYKNMINVIKKSRAKIVWVGLGAKKQVVVVDRLNKLLPNRIYVTVGAAFDFLSGNKKQAPKWLRQMGGEWLYRLISEPQRLGARYWRIFWFMIFRGWRLI